MSKTLVRTAIIGLSLTFCILAAGAGASDLTVATADGPRHALIYPAGIGPHPVVLVLHGHLGTAAQAARGSGFIEAAKARGFTAVFPDGRDRRWRDGRAGGDATGPNDVAFLRALAEQLIRTGVAEKGRLYIAGISNGGMMSFAMACQAPDLFAGVGAVISAMPAGMPKCDLKPQPLVMIAGDADPMVPYRGGGVGLHGQLGEVLGVEQTAQMFAKVDGCSGRRTDAVPHRDPSERTQVERIAWTGCRNGETVDLYRIHGGGHAYPGNPPLAFGLLGPTNHDIVPATVMMDVFAARQ